MNNNTTAPRVKKESKNKIKVEFDRAPLRERLKAKYLNAYFYKKILVAIFRFVLLLGISYIILFPQDIDLVHEPEGHYVLEARNDQAHPQVPDNGHVEIPHS